MNYEQTQEAIKVMQHYAAGGEIEHRDRPTSCSREWLPLIDPYWDWSTTEYRIKPKLLERWFLVDADGDARCASMGFASAGAADMSRLTIESRDKEHAPYRIVHMVEVTP